VEYRPLGATGVQVSPLCLGAMMFGAWGNPDHDESIRIIHAALDAGINFVDTADIYSAGESEEIIAKALAGRRDDVFLATKVGYPIGDDPHRRGASRRRIITGVEESLRRLRTDWIDLCQVHRPDPLTDIEETLSALSDLVHQGKVRNIGHSTFPASEIVEGQWIARERGHQLFRCEQATYSMLVRGVEYDVLPTCRRHGMGVITYSPLGGGWLSGRYRQGGGEGPTSPSRQTVAERFDSSLLANERKLEAVLRHPAVSAAIIGPRTMDHLESQVTAAEVVLSDDVLDRIDEIVAPGTTINPADNGWIGSALEASSRRRSL
jgi:aryl-alcohol dehydrogenase-like predicted oxidoreductase